MKIADVRTVVVGNPWKNWIYVVVETDEGLIGVGEATGGSETQPRVAAVEEVKHLIIGMDPRNVHEIFHKLYLTAFIKVTPAKVRSTRSESRWRNQQMYRVAVRCAVISMCWR